MLLALLLACPHGTPVALTVVPTAHGTPLRCGEPVDVAGGTVTVRDLRWFVHDIELVGADGRARPLLLDDDPWQHGGAALLDHEDGCHNGTAATHDTLTGRTSARAPFQAVRWKVGLPAELNHADPLGLEPPLTTTAMHWGWRQGFKYVRLDVVRDGTPARIHLGATGCQGPMGAVTGCAHPHLGTQVLPVVGTAVPLDLGPALDATTTGCMADDGDPGCAPWFTAFGMAVDPLVAEVSR